LDVSAATCDQKKKILDLAADTRKFEIELFWKRSLFFWGFIGVAFISYAALYKNGENDLRAIIASFGLVCSVAWTLQNRGSKYWHQAWEQKVVVVEAAVLGAELFSNEEPRKTNLFWGGRRYSVSGLAIALSDFTVIIWLTLLLATLRQHQVVDLVKSIDVPFVALCVASVWVALMYFANRRRDR
jgi:energy-coupling factor transporter transmembrane protein EcfT